LGSDGLFEILKRVGLEKSDSNVDEALDSILGKDREEPTKGIDTTKDLEGKGSSSAIPGQGKASQYPNGDTGTHQQRFATYVYVSNSGSNDDEQNRDDYFRQEKIGRAGVDYAIEQDRNLGFEVKEMPHTNEGYDLEIRDKAGQIQRYVEVKATGEKWGHRGVALSYPQFQSAQLHKEKFWLYVIENADKQDRQLYRIPNPAANTQNFVFDDGWKNLTLE
jgi:hypothetical protein